MEKRPKKRIFFGGEKNVEDLLHRSKSGIVNEFDCDRISRERERVSIHYDKKWEKIIESQPRIPLSHRFASVYRIDRGKGSVIYKVDD